jgi:Cu/Ag efflux protein CusF
MYSHLFYSPLKIKNMKKKFGVLFIASALISLISLTNVKAQNPKGEAVVSTQTVAAEVKSINQKTREVTILTTDGEVYKFIAGPDVKNLAQVKKGDIITAVYTEALSYEVRSHGSTGVITANAAAAAKPGEKPAAAAGKQTTVTVKITAIDTKNPSVTVQGSDGEVEKIKVKDPSKLTGLKVGDMVDITYTEALAIKVDSSK